MRPGAPAEPSPSSLARAGAFVYATGRSSRVSGPSDMDRPETIEETGDLIAAAGGDGVALTVDHLEVDAVRDLVDRIRADRGRLDVLVNDIFGGDRYAQWEQPLWGHDLAGRSADAADGGRDAHR